MTLGDCTFSMEHGGNIMVVLCSKTVSITELSQDHWEDVYSSLRVRMKTGDH